MAFITMSENLSVKIKSIDDQHSKLFDLINDFYDNIKNRSNVENILGLINGMKEYTQSHFKTEENFMLQLNYPYYDAHKNEHDIFISKITTVEDKIRSGKLVVSFEITGFLRDWLKNHIQVTDKKYSSFFIQNGIK